MNRGLLAAGALSAALVAGLSSAAAFQQSSASSEAAGLFDAKCKGCHDPAIDRAPSREALAQRAPEAVVQALTRGSMSAMAAGLTPEMIRELAVYVTGKPITAATGSVAAAIAAGAQPPDNMCAAANPAIHAAASDWDGYGKDLAADRFQRTTRLNAGNVDRLKVKWAFSLAGGRAGQPTVIGDHMFLVTFAGDAYSLDAHTGCVHWRVKLSGPARESPLVVQRKGASPSGWVMYVGDNTRDFHAFDAMTGKELWKVNLDSHPLSMLTGGPAIFGDRIYVPISSSEENTGNLPSYSCCTFAGEVAAIDLKTGKLEWKTRLLDPRPTRKNSSGTQLYGPAGAAVWSQPSIDAKRGQLYVATGDSYTEVDAPNADAVVAIDLKSGKIKWSTQVTQVDNFLIGCNGGARQGVNCPLGTTGPDFDYGASPILATAAGGKQMVLSGQKSGMVYGMAPDTGKLVWTTRVSGGSALGGIEWGMAADGKAVYAAASDAANRGPTAKPGLTALDILTGKQLWHFAAIPAPCGWGPKRCGHGQSAPPTAIPGVVFSGGHDGWLRAFDVKTGRTLWNFDSAGQTYATVNGVAKQPGGSFDHTGFVVTSDMLYAVSGYNGATNAFGNPLNVLLAFSLDGK